MTDTNTIIDVPEKKNIVKILSFDVGIINLAYCLVDFNLDNETFTIHDWNIMDLADDRHTCPFIMRGNKVCNKVAKSRTTFNKQNIHYRCKAHAQKGFQNIFYDFKVEWKNICDDEDNKDKDNECNENNNNYCCMCTKKQVIGKYKSELFDGYYCKTHHKTISRQSNLICAASKCNNFITKAVHTNDGEVIIGWCSEHHSEYEKYFKKKTKTIKQSANHIPLMSVGKAMYDHLDKHPEFLDVDEVLIENQEVNSHMKSVAGLLYSYFFMKGVHQVKTDSKLNIQYCSASLKVTVGGKNSVQNIKDAKAKADEHHNETNKIQYNATKLEGKKICEALIKGDDKVNKFYQSLYYAHKKKDDLADALLQAMAKYMKPLPEHYMNKITYINAVNNIKDSIKSDGLNKSKNVKTVKTAKTAKNSKNVKTAKTKNTKNVKDKKSGAPLSKVIKNPEKREVIINEEMTINIKDIGIDISNETIQNISFGNRA